MKTIEAERAKDPRTKQKLVQIPRIYGDEKVWELAELNKLTLDYKELRRWQFVYVIRNDEVVEWVSDLGPASAFPYCSEFRLFSFGQDTVDQIQEEAMQMRIESTDFRKMLAEHQAESTLTRDYVAFLHEKVKQLRNESVFGPGFTRQRNLFARRKA